MTQPPRDLAAQVEDHLHDDPSDPASLRESTEGFDAIATLLSDELRKAQG